MPLKEYKCLRDRTRIGGGTRTDDAAAFATSSPRTRGAPSPTSRTVWSTTYSPRMATRTTTPFPSVKGGTGLRRHRAPPPTGTGSLLLEELEPSGPAHRDHGEGPPLQPELPPPPALPPMFQGTLTEDHWRRIPADVRNCLGFPLGTGAVQDRVLSNAARQASLAQEGATRAYTGALATAKATHAKAATSHVGAERRTRAATEERFRVMREWEEEDRARAAEVAVAARKSQEAGAAVQRAKRVLAKTGDKHRHSGRVPAATAAVAPYSSSILAVPAAGTPYKAPGPYPAAVAAENPGPGPWAVPRRTANAALLSCLFFGRFTCRESPCRGRWEPPGCSSRQIPGRPARRCCGSPSRGGCGPSRRGNTDHLEGRGLSGCQCPLHGGGGQDRAFRHGSSGPGRGSSVGSAGPATGSAAIGARREGQDGPGFILHPAPHRHRARPLGRAQERPRVHVRAHPLADPLGVRR